MKAIVRHAFGSVEELKIEDVKRPIPASNEVLIKIKAFGINRAELYMRMGLWGDVVNISGIECVGIIEEDPNNTFDKGQKVAAVMGGMGRTINGSYAEYTCVPIENVISLNTTLSWSVLAAMPESYLTAWACLYQNLKLESNQTLAVIGGTSALGQAAINIAVADGVEVITTTRNKNHADHLRSLGVKKVIINESDNSNFIKSQYPNGIDAVLDIVGNTTILDSLKMVKKGGTVCNAGFLGGGDPILFNPLSDMPPSVNLNFFASFMFGTSNFPLSEIPLQQLVDNASDNIYKCEPAHVFQFDEIKKAHLLMESNNACGKIVIRL